MTLPTSGQISLYSIRTELGLGAVSIGLTDTNVRSLGNKATGSVTMPADFYGKSAGSVSNTLGSLTNSSITGTVSANLSFLTNGTWTLTTDGSATPDMTGNWYSPTTTNIGQNFWVKFTRTAISGSGTASATTGWLNITNVQSVSVQITGNAIQTATYTVDISSSSSGTPILGTATGVILTAESGI